MQKRFLLSCLLALSFQTAFANSEYFDSGDDFASSNNYHPESSTYLQSSQHQVFFGVSYNDYFDGTKGKSFLVSQGSAGETDYLLQNSSKNEVGVLAGYARQWMFGNPSLSKSYGFSLGLRLQYSPGKFSGFTNQDASHNPQFNNFTYTYSVDPVDILGQGDLFLMNMGHTVLPYLSTGVGFTIARMSYNEVALGNVPRSAAKITGQTAVTPLFVIGGGLQFDLARAYFMKLEYLYHLRGNSGFENPAFIGRMPVNLNEQSVNAIFGVRL